MCQDWQRVPLEEGLPLVLCAPHLEVRCCARGPLCTVSVDLLTASVPLRLVPLHPVPVLRSGVQDRPPGNSPDFGFAALCADRLCFLFKHQLHSGDLPLVGVWVSGVDSIQHPFLWLVCAQFLMSGRPFSRPSEIFVVAVLAGSETLFYNCLCPPGRPRLELQLWQGQASTSIARVPSASNRTLTVPLESVVSGKVSEDMLWAHQQLSSLPSPVGSRELPSQDLRCPGQPLRMTPTVPEVSDFSVAPSCLGGSLGDAPLPTSAVAELSLQNPWVPEQGTGPEAVYELIRRQDEQLRELRLQLEQLLQRQARDDKIHNPGGNQTCNPASPREPYTVFFPEKLTPGAMHHRDQATGRSPLLPDRPTPAASPALLQGSAKAARLEGTETLIVPRLEYQSLRLVSGELAAPCSPQGALSVATQRYLHQYGLLDPESALDEGPILDISALKKLPKLL
ncbi:hypothetical protein IscW_ISCW003435 [Ixodes scapularis]|uniref:STIL N-terminal domain-containing protein n=1 Tax=Ixodes scapularis TaxID=6945 RepID=B7PDB9_IXOSC|nr:hypothetical protein IscW_ISCW003435 [Ixodes scapularis]|eukprot:XP_002410719.1 hypothetical protein IscW_ISCW003435 [Ixodes scapularis]